MSNDNYGQSPGAGGSADNPNPWGQSQPQDQHAEQADQPQSAAPSGYPESSSSAGYPESSPSAGYPESSPSAGYAQSYDSAGYSQSAGFDPNATYQAQPPAAGYGYAGQPQPGQVQPGQPQPGQVQPGQAQSGQSQWGGPQGPLDAQWNAPQVPQNQYTAQPMAQPKPADDNPLSALVDFSFTKYATPGLVKFVYIAAAILMALWVVGMVITWAQLPSILFPFGDVGAFSVLAGFLAFIGGSLVFIVALLGLRVMLELAVAMIRMTKDVNKLASKTDEGDTNLP